MFVYYKSCVNIITHFSENMRKSTLQMWLSLLTSPMTHMTKSRFFAWSTWSSKFWLSMLRCQQQTGSVRLSSSHAMLMTSSVLWPWLAFLLSYFKHDYNYCMILVLMSCCLFMANFHLKGSFTFLAITQCSSAVYMLTCIFYTIYFVHFLKWSFPIYKSRYL